MWLGFLVLPLLAGCGGGGPGLTGAGNERQRHEAAVERIEGLGGGVEFGGSGSSVRFFQADPGAIAEGLSLVSHLLRPESVTIVPAGGRDAAAGAIELADLGELPELRHVLIRGMRLSEADRRYLLGRPNLRELHLINTDLTDRQLSEMATELELRELRLVDQPITDTGVVNLRRMRTLLRLRLIGTRVSAAAAEDLTEAIPRLTVELDGQTIRGEYAP